ncbi:anaerobic ribonucleoside-triphosphate reductase activating protein [bacterium]|nr:anaerobic ribonucleoside-triphosphate reductase activating protein [bacterium]
MNIGGFVKTSLSDFPGHIAAVIFISGCNLRCPFCHNPDLVTHPERTAESAEGILEFLASRRTRLTGVVISGGEPLMQDDLPSLLGQIHRLGLAVKIDTNGTFPGMLERVIDSGLCSYVAMDIKSSPEEYARAAGGDVPLDLIRRSIRILKESGLPHEFRTTVVPGLHTVQTIAGIGSLIDFAHLYILQHFSGLRTLSPSYTGLRSFNETEMAALGDAARPFCGQLFIR